MFIPNGVLIQDIDSPTDYVTKFNYSGIHAYHSFPLMNVNDPVCRKLMDEQMNKRVGENEWIILELISENDLLKRYAKECKKQGFDIRIIFIESGYADEVWNEHLPEMDFLGYEYSPFPVDMQIITDMDWYEPFIEYHNILNEHGLFSKYDDISEFVKAYGKAFASGNIGDGEADAYICKVYEVRLEDIL